MLIDQFKVKGVPSSIAVDNETNKIFVGYYDEPQVSIFDLKTKAVICNIKTTVTSAYANLIAVNKDYIFLLSAAKTISFIKKTDISLAKEIDLSLIPCGAVNSIKLSGENLLVISTNKAIGNKDTRKDIFIYDLATDKLVASDSGIYIKTTIVSNNRIFVFGNFFEQGKSQSIVKEFSLSKLVAGIVEPMQVVHLDQEEIEHGFSYISSKNDFNKAFIQTKNSKKLVEVKDGKIFLSENLTDEQINGFIHSTAIGTSTYKVVDNQYYLNTVDISSKAYTASLKLEGKTVTDAATLSNDIFYFGVDKSIYMLQLSDK